MKYHGKAAYADSWPKAAILLFCGWIYGAHAWIMEKGSAFP
jgi:hypothetical protein